MTGDTLLLQPEDDVAVALRELPGVPRGHKVAVRDLAAGAPIRKYGQVIGVATAPIAAGEHVHTHNLGMGPHDREYAFGTDLREVAPVAGPARFQGIVRPDEETCGSH
jgi:altronate hydrolase